MTIYEEYTRMYLPMSGVPCIEGGLGFDKLPSPSGKVEVHISGHRICNYQYFSAKW